MNLFPCVFPHWSSIVLLIKITYDFHVALPVSWLCPHLIQQCYELSMILFPKYNSFTDFKDTHALGFSPTSLALLP